MGGPERAFHPVAAPAQTTKETEDGLFLTGRPGSGAFPLPQPGLMFRIIPRPVHAATDYLYAAALAASPSVVGFEDEENAAFVARALAGTTVLASLLTRYEISLIPLIPFNLHLKLDFLAAIPTMAAPWLLGFENNKKARNTFLAFAIFEIVAVLLSRRNGD